MRKSRAASTAACSCEPNPFKACESASGSLTCYPLCSAGRVAPISDGLLSRAKRQREQNLPAYRCFGAKVARFPCVLSSNIPFVASNSFFMDKLLSSTFVNVLSRAQGFDGSTNKYLEIAQLTAVGAVDRSLATDSTGKMDFSGIPGGDFLA